MHEQPIIRHSPSIILGIDPGLQRMGWGIIEYKANHLIFIACGTVKTDAKLSLAERLVMLHEGVAHLIEHYKPTNAAIEETFVNVNGASTLKLGQARGAILLSLALGGLIPGEYSANLVKKSITGNGHAAKEQVTHMVNLLLPGACTKEPDAADALAIAICHAHHR